MCAADSQPTQAHVTGEAPLGRALSRHPVALDINTNPTLASLLGLEWLGSPLGLPPPLSPRADFTPVRPGPTTGGPRPFISTGVVSTKRWTNETAAQPTRSQLLAEGVLRSTLPDDTLHLIPWPMHTPTNAHSRHPGLCPRPVTLNCGSGAAAKQRRCGARSRVFAPLPCDQPDGLPLRAPATLQRLPCVPERSRARNLPMGQKFLDEFVVAKARGGTCQHIQGTVPAAGIRQTAQSSGRHSSGQGRVNVCTGRCCAEPSRA